MTELSKKSEYQQTCEAFAIALGLDPDEMSQREWGRLTKALKDIKDIKGEYPPLNEFARRATNYLLMYGKLPTPTALSGNWAMCKNAPPTKKQINKFIQQQELQELEDWANQNG
jgi:hypothetical protein